MHEADVIKKVTNQLPKPRLQHDLEASWASTKGIPCLFTVLYLRSDGSLGEK